MARSKKVRSTKANPTQSSTRGPNGMLPPGKTPRLMRAKKS